MWHENMLGYLFADFTFFEKRTIFREQSSRETVSVKEQIMSKKNYPSKFLKSNGGYCVHYPSIIFRNTRDFLKIGEYHSIFPNLGAHLVT